MSKRSRYFHNPYGQDLGDIVTDLTMVKEVLLPTTIKCITQSEKQENGDADGNLYVGAAGIAYAFYHASQADLSLSQSHLQRAQHYLLTALQGLERCGGNDLSCGFLCGDAGVIAVASVIAASIGDNEKSYALAKRYADFADVCRPVTFFPPGSDEFFVGRAGYMYGALWLNKKLGKQVVPLEVLHELAKITIISGKNYAIKNSSPCPLMYAYYGTEYLGAAHGLSTILQTLIQIPNFLDMNRDADSLVHTCVDYLLSLKTPSGNYPCALDEVGHNNRPEEDELVHWCHGAPGIVYLLAAAYLRWRDQRYMDACLCAGELVWSKGLLDKGPGLCHGVAGNGYVFLLLYRLTHEPIHLSRAAKFADFLTRDEFKRNARTPDKPYSLYEGLAGTLCFLADLGRPEEAAFPFQDVFL